MRKKLLTKGSSVFDSILDVLVVLGAAILTFIMLAVCWDVIARTVAGKPLKWVLEFSEYSLLYMGFLCTAWVLRKERHVTSDLLLNTLSPKNRAFLNTITSILGAIICVVLTWYGAKVSLDKLRMGAFQPTPMQPPDFPLFIIIPIGSCLLSIQFLRRAYNNLGIWKASRIKKN